jgi:hypothetical protein
MTANIHPTSSELATAVTEPGQAGPTLAHVDECLACRVLLSRIRHDLRLQPPDDDSVQRILAASAPLPEGLGDLLQAPRQGDPRPGEIWRAGRDEALLVWVRLVFDDGVADVIPLVLDIELADQETVVIEADATPLASELAAMVALRTHIDFGAFINRIGVLDLYREVTEVRTAVKEGRRPSGIRVGPPIDDDNDQRIEYRQALRDLLGELTPSAWAMAGFATGHALEDKPPEHLADIKTRLGERVDGVQFRGVDEQVITLSGGTRLSAALKVTCLDTAILVVTADAFLPDDAEVVEACNRMVIRESDADAVAVAVPAEDWETSLFTRAHLRPAIELPGGASVGPKVTLSGHNLVEILVKYLQDVTSPWEVTEPVAVHLPQRSVRQIALRYAEAEIGRISQDGRRAHQPAKKAGWQTLPTGLGEQVARFVDAIVHEKPIDEALGEIELGDPR